MHAQLRRSLRQLVPAAMLAVGLVPDTFAQRVPGELQSVRNPFRLIEQRHDSGLLTAPAEGGAPVWQAQVGQPGAPWLIVVFEELALEEGGLLELTSLADGQVQYLDEASARAWSRNSAAFRGDGVRLRLFAGDGPGVRVRLQGVLAGDPPPAGDSGDASCSQYTAGLCDGDGRVPSYDDRVGRTYPNIGTAFRASNGACLTAGRLLDVSSSGFVPNGSLDVLLVQFAEATEFPGDVDHQYPVQYDAPGGWADDIPHEAEGPGRDWAILTLGPNSNTGLLPAEAYGPGFWLSLVDPPHGATVRVTGHGYDNSPWASGSCGLNATSLLQQTATGPHDDADDMGPGAIAYDFSVDAAPGNEGSPLIVASTGAAIGVVTDFDCVDEPYSDDGNRATAFRCPTFKAALIAHGGGDVIYVAKAHPQASASGSGSIFAPFQTWEQAQAFATPSHDVVALLEATPNHDWAPPAGTDLTLIAPNGGVYLGP